MKKVLKVASVIFAPLIFVCTFLASCKSGKSSVDGVVDTGEIMRDINVKPDQTAAYEQYTRQVIDEYKSVANSHRKDDGDVDTENADVITASNSAAAKLFAYACYNTRTLDKYVFFSDQEGDTDLGIMGAATARKQEYYLRVNESEQTCGYRYHYTLKKVIDASGAVSGLKSTFQSARLRVTDQTDLLYRFEGKGSKGSDSYIVFGSENPTLGVEMLNCEWETGSDWGVPDVVMRKSEFIEPDKIEEDIKSSAGAGDLTIRGNINILAENIIKNSIISIDDDGNASVFMFIDTDVANRDEASLTMLREANSSKDCLWQKGEEESDTGLMIVFQLWENGLFRTLTVKERWSGKISGFSGAADSLTTYYYSYSDRDCDMTKNLQVLEEAKKLKG